MFSLSLFPAIRTLSLRMVTPISSRWFRRGNAYFLEVFKAIRISATVTPSGFSIKSEEIIFVASVIAAAEKKMPFWSITYPLRTSSRNSFRVIESGSGG